MGELPGPWLVATRGLAVYTLDLPSADSATTLDLNESDRGFFGEEWASGEAFHGTGEAEHITALFGDSASFDFSPYRGLIDVMFIDGAHSYSYVSNDTRVALEVVSAGGTVDDYPTIPGVHRLLDELGPTLDRPLYHVLGTRLVLYSRQDIVARVPDYGHVGKA